MVCECLRSAPLSAVTHLQRRTAPDAMRIRHDQAGSAPDNAGAAATFTAPHLNYGLPQQLTHSVEI
jgi:hypothetical protein